MGTVLDSDALPIRLALVAEDVTAVLDSVLDFSREELERAGFTYQYLDGSTPTGAPGRSRT